MGAGSQGSPLGGVGTAASFLIQGASPGSQWSPGASPPDAALDGGWQDTQDCCQGDCAPRVSMATAPWTAPHHCLAAVAQATHGLSWLLQLWGTQGLGVGDSAGRPLSARQQCWDWRGMMCPLPKAVATIAAGLGACLGQRYLCRVAPRTHSQT